jgi:IS605 OrfB family transposase
MIKKKNSVNITTITRKIEVVPIIHVDAMDELDNISDKVELKKLRKKIDEDVKLKKNEIYKTIRFWKNLVYRAFNRGMTSLMGLTHITDYNILKDEHEKDFLFKLNNDPDGILNTSLQNVPYRVIVKDFPELPGYIKEAISNSVYSKYKQYRYDIQTGKASIPSFNKNQPIPFKARAIKNLRTENDDIVFDFLNNIKFKFDFGKDKSGNKLIIEKIISGEYKLGGSSFTDDGKKTFFNITVSYENKKIELYNEIVIGVDLGINIPVMIAVCKNGKMISTKSVGSRETFLDKRNSIIKARRRLQSDLTSAKSGHGIGRKLRIFNDFGSYERNWVKNQNHIFSKIIVETALTNKAATIKMEDLSGIGDKNKYLLQRWSYYELQQMVIYKAKQVGIEVILVDPKYTSQKCSECGHIHEDNRKTQSLMDCVSCGHVENADVNAAINISRAVKLKKEKEE